MSTYAEIGRYIMVVGIIAFLAFLCVPPIPSNLNETRPFPWPVFLITPIACGALNWLLPRRVQPRWLLPIVLLVFVLAVRVAQWQLQSWSRG